MREWVETFIKEEGILKSFEGEDEIYYYLTEYFNVNFGHKLDGIMDTAFGSTLSDLPEEVFHKLRKMGGVFYSYSIDYFGEVKLFSPEQDNGAGSLVKFVSFPNHIVSLGSDILRGIIVHEFAHIFSNHLFGDNKCEDEADELAVSWGFSREINALRVYAKKLFEAQKQLVQ